MHLRKGCSEAQLLSTHTHFSSFVFSSLSFSVHLAPHVSLSSLFPVSDRSASFALLCSLLSFIAPSLSFFSVHPLCWRPALPITILPSRPLLQDKQQMQQKLDTLTREVFDLQETINWKDKKIGVGGCRITCRVMETNRLLLNTAPPCQGSEGYELRLKRFPLIICGL